MKRIALFFLFLLFFLPVVNGSAANENTSSRVLVLGFDLPGADAVERRFVREEVMRELQKAGVQVVPVMELEGFFMGENPVRENPVPTESMLRSWAERIPSGIVLAGRCERDASGNWTILCMIYSVRENTFRNETLRIKGSPLPDTKELSGGIIGMLSGQATSHL